MSKIAAVIPCYNVEKYCRKVIEETLPLVDYLILVDDGSTDKTHRILEEMRSLSSKIKLVSFSKNRGKGAALHAGFKEALLSPCDILIALDSDGQHKPSDIPKLAKRIEEGADAVMGVREFSQMPFRSKIANSIISFLLKLLYKKAPKDTQTGYRAFTRPVAQKICDQIKEGHYEMEFRCLLLLLKNKNRLEEYPIETIYLDKNRSSHFSVIKDSYRILKVFFEFCFTKQI